MSPTRFAMRKQTTQKADLQNQKQMRTEQEIIEKIKLGTKRASMRLPFLRFEKEIKKKTY